MSLAEFDEEEKYACAAVFVLALHQVQVDGGAARVEEATGIWGRPVLDDFAGEEASASEVEKADVSAARWAAYWGWDCYGPGGLLDHLFKALGLPERSWSGLKRLPEVGGLSSALSPAYTRLVASYVRVLDPSLPTSHLASTTAVATPNVGPGLPANTGGIARRESQCSSDAEPDAESRPVHDFLEGVASDSDSDLEADLANAHLASRIQRQTSGHGRGTDLRDDAEADRPLAHPADGLRQSSGGEPGRANPSDTVAGAGILEGVEPSLESKRSFSRAEAVATAMRQWQGVDATELECVDEARESAFEGGPVGTSGCNPAAAARDAVEEARGQSDDEGSRRRANNEWVCEKALAALWVLLEACILHVNDMQPRASGSGDVEPEDSLLEGETERCLVGGVRPSVRWYDARARAALRLTAHWLRLPWRLAANFEGLLAHRLLLPPDAAGRMELTPWERGARAVKIGAATLTIGALFALTGGVAAPAIAGGVGTAIGLAGGSAAVAAGVSGFLGTAAGGAVIASTVGAAGVGLSAPHVARRIGNVKEFGFWPLTTDTAAECEAAAEFPEPASGAAADGQHRNIEQHVGAAQNAQNALGDVSARSNEAAAAILAKQCADAGADDSVQLLLPRPADSHGSPSAATAATATHNPAASSALCDGGSERRELNGASLDAADNASDSGHIMLGGMVAGVGAVRAPASGSPAASVASSIAGKPLRRAEPKAGTDKPAEASWWWQRKPAQESDPPLLPTPLALGRRVEDMRMSLTIGVSGWISARRDFRAQWAHLARRPRAGEAFALVWESRELRDLNSAVVDFAASQAGQEAAKWVLQHFFFTGLVAALAWPALIYSAVQLIDTAWSVALQRAQQAGRLLAHVLAAGAHGDRPVTLVGNSMGARLVFHCLLELSRLKAKGVVEHACLLGMPVSLRPERWAMARSVVAGRLVNGFSRNDWLLAVVYRGTSGFAKDAAGLRAAPFPGVENVNLTGLVEGHFGYTDKTAEILDSIALFD